MPEDRSIYRERKGSNCRKIAGGDLSIKRIAKWQRCKRTEAEAEEEGRGDGETNVAAEREVGLEGLEGCVDAHVIVKTIGESPTETERTEKWDSVWNGVFLKALD